MLIAGGEHDSHDVFLSLFFKHVIVSLFEGNGSFFRFSLSLGLLLLFIDFANASLLLHLRLLLCRSSSLVKACYWFLMKLAVTLATYARTCVGRIAWCGWERELFRRERAPRELEDEQQVRKKELSRERNLGKVCIQKHEIHCVCSVDLVLFLLLLSFVFLT